MLKKLKKRLGLKLKGHQEKDQRAASRKRFIGINLTLFLIVNASQMVIGKFLGVNSAWVFWDAVMLFNAMLLSFTLFLSVEYRPVFNKIISFAVFIICCWFALDYAVLTINEHYKNDIVLMSLITNAIFFIYFVPHFIFLCIRSYTQAGDDYEDDKTYVAYKAPKSAVGIVCALITSPHGSQSLVIRGRQFIFKGGLLIERKYIYKKNDLLKQVQDVNIQALRCTLGEKWSVKNNCFAFFNKYIHHIKNEKFN